MEESNTNGTVEYVRIGFQDSELFVEIYQDTRLK